MTVTPQGDRPSEEEQERIYNMLLAGDANAPSELFAAFFPSLHQALIAKFHDIYDTAIVEDAVFDTLLNTPKIADKFDPARSKLWSYLYSDAHGDILNELDRQRRLDRRSVDFGLGDVEDLVPDRNIDVEAGALDRLEPLINELLPPGVDLQAVLEQAREIVVNPDDEQILQLMLDGERSTAAYVTILDIDALPAGEQQREVKRHKDRLKIRLKRLKDILT
jgi:DNA-directed RNA polymerase specialized sigma24 family protein